MERKHRQKVRTRNFLLHPHVTSSDSLFALPRGTDLDLSPQLFPPLLRLSCASGSEMEWISGGGGDEDPLRQNNRREKTWKSEGVSAPSFLSFFSIIFCPSVSVPAAAPLRVVAWLVMSSVRNSNLGLCFFAFKCCVSQLSVQPADIGWPTGNGKKQSCSQA